MPVIDPLDDFLFDTFGFIVRRGFVEPDHLTRLNAAFDRLPAIQRGEWAGASQRRDYTAGTGYELHHCVEFDPAFAELIDHPGWITHVRHWAGEEDTYVEGVFLDECIATTRQAGGHHPVHSGGYQSSVRTQYRYEHGRFRCGQVNVLLAVSDVGPGDGATMVIPGSHKSNFTHPLAGDYSRDERMDLLPGAQEVHLAAGDAILFVDSIMHGGSSRTTVGGERRVVIFRYGPSWGRTRFGYEYTADFVAGLTPARRHVVQPVPPIRPGDARIPAEAPWNREPSTRVE